MDSILEELSGMIEAGKIDLASPYPAELRGKAGAVELTKKALAENIDPKTILNEGLIRGLNRVGEKFARGEAFIPSMLISARAMSAAMEALKPYLRAGAIEDRGTLILGTVQGDLHDIGKNLVKMVMQSAGWNVVDLGTDVSAEKFIETLKLHKGAIIGLSALLTTTMLAMGEVVRRARVEDPSAKVYIGGAPVSQAFCDQIGADGYFADPYSFAKAAAVM